MDDDAVRTPRRALDDGFDSTLGDATETTSFHKADDSLFQVLRNTPAPREARNGEETESAEQVQRQLQQLQQLNAVFESYEAALSGGVDQVEVGALAYPDLCEKDPRDRSAARRLRRPTEERTGAAHAARRADVARRDQGTQCRLRRTPPTTPPSSARRSGEKRHEPARPPSSRCAHHSGRHAACRAAHADARRRIQAARRLHAPRPRAHRPARPARRSRRRATPAQARHAARARRRACLCAAHRTGSLYHYVARD